MWNKGERRARQEAREQATAARFEEAQLHRIRRHVAQNLEDDLNGLDRIDLETATVGTLAGLAIDSIVAGNNSPNYYSQQANYARATALANLALVRSQLYPEEIQPDHSATTAAPITPQA